MTNKGLRGARGRPGVGASPAESAATRSGHGHALLTADSTGALAIAPPPPPAEDMGGERTAGHPLALYGAALPLQVGSATAMYGAFSPVGGGSLGCRARPSPLSAPCATSKHGSLAAMMAMTAA
jgi:hypothetical protein